MKRKVYNSKNTGGQWVENIFNPVIFKEIWIRIITREWKGPHRLPVGV